MDNVIQLKGGSKVICHLPEAPVPRGVPEAIDTSTEYYEIHDFVRFDNSDPAKGQGSIATLWFQPRTNTAIVGGQGYGPDMVLPTELMPQVYTLCRPQLQAVEMWMLHAILSGCFTAGHRAMYAFDDEGDQYTICSRCGKRSFTGFVSDEDEDESSKRPLWKGGELLLEAYIRPENLPERTAFFHAGVPIVDFHGNVIGTLLMYPVEYEDAMGVAIAADEFEEESCRVTIVISLEDLYVVISRMALEEAHYTLYTLEEPEADEYFELPDISEWTFGIEWGPPSLNRKVTLTYPVTTAYDDEGYLYEAHVDKTLFFISLMAIRQAVESKRRLNDEPYVT